MGEGEGGRSYVVSRVPARERRLNRPSPTIRLSEIAGLGLEWEISVDSPLRVPEFTLGDNSVRLFMAREQLTGRTALGASPKKAERNLRRILLRTISNN